jgi:hypothetical protein
VLRSHSERLQSLDWKTPLVLVPKKNVQVVPPRMAERGHLSENLFPKGYTRKKM